MAIYLFSQILKFTKFRIKLIEKLPRRHFINSSDVFVIKGFTVVCYKDSIPLLQYETEDWRCFNPSFFLILVFQTPQFDLITKTNLCGLLNISWCQTYNL